MRSWLESISCFTLIFVKEWIQISPLALPQNKASIVAGFGYQELGCFSDKYPTERALNLNGIENKSTSEKMTPDLCIERCGKTGAQYCGVEFKNECFCGNNDNYNRFGNLEDDKDCTLLCKGNSSLKCGGNNAIFIYNVSRVSAGTSHSHVREFMQENSKVSAKVKLSSDGIANISTEPNVIRSKFDNITEETTAMKLTQTTTNSETLTSSESQPSPSISSDTSTPTIHNSSATNGNSESKSRTSAHVSGARKKSESKVEQTEFNRYGDYFGTGLGVGLAIILIMGVILLLHRNQRKPWFGRFTFTKNYQQTIAQSNPIYQNDVILASVNVADENNRHQSDLSSSIAKDGIETTASDATYDLPRKSESKSTSGDSMYANMQSEGYENIDEGAAKRITPADTSIYQLAGPIVDDLIVAENELYGS